MIVSVQYKCLIFNFIISGIIATQINDNNWNPIDRTNSCLSSVINNGRNGQVCGTSRVRAGVYNQMGAHPWIARVAFINSVSRNVQFPCSGSIINNRVVLTAAHCALNKFDNYKLLGVRVGEWSANTDRDCNGEFCALPVQDITISHVIVHPGYDQPQPICLPQSYTAIYNYGLLVGWGKLAGQYETQGVQQTLHLPIVGLQQCFNIYGRTLVNDYHLCVGGQAGRDACEGFLGSPLIDEQGGIYFQIGILSFGSDRCGVGGVPSVYVNVNRYVNWIRDNLPTFRNK